MEQGVSQMPRPPAQRGMYVLPSLFTAGNIAIGYYIIMQSIRGSMLGDSAAFDYAAMGVAVAILFDGLDGRIARMTNTSSAFGRELDSLADVITFGVAPSLLAYLWGVRLVVPSGYPIIHARLLHFGVVVCFLFLICGACRLARFNISVNPHPINPGRPGRKYFVGMPIPAGAGVIASVVHRYDGSWIVDPRMSILFMVLLLGTGFLMVSNWRFWSGKEIESGSRMPFQVVVLLCFGIAVIWKFSEFALIAIALGYLVSGLLARIAYGWQRRRRLSADAGQGN